MKIECNVCGSPVKVTGESTLHYALDKQVIAKEIIALLPEFRENITSPRLSEIEKGYILGLNLCKTVIKEWAK